MYLRRNETNFRVLSKSTAQGSIPCVKKAAHNESTPDNERHRDESDLSPLFLLPEDAAPAPIDIVAFGKRLGEIITKAVMMLHRHDEFPPVEKNHAKDSG
jgi:hypothetical protein